MKPTHDIVAAQIDRIEAEMKRIGYWQDTPPPPENLVITQAFGADKLSFEQWLQFIFVPRVREIIQERGEFPRNSQVADKAYREWKMWGDAPDTENLIQLLRDFDALFTH